MRNRPAHDQRLTLLDRVPPRKVDGVQFIAHVDSTSLKFDRHGGLEVRLIIPKEFVELGLDVRFLEGVPLSVDVQRWKAVPAEPEPGPLPHPGAPPPLEAGSVGTGQHPSNPAFRRERNGG
jgi:hypothetical protein